MPEPLPTIYLHVGIDPFETIFGRAIADDGTILGSAEFDSLEKARVGMGVTDRKEPKSYRRHYPDGFRLEWVDDPDTHEGYRAALGRYLAMLKELETKNDRGGQETGTAEILAERGELLDRMD